MTEFSRFAATILVYFTGLKRKRRGRLAALRFFLIGGNMKKDNLFSGTRARWAWGGVPALVFALLLTVTARANLTLTNYTAAHPLKVLAIGDSITDDSVTNGAWRAYLEPLLVANGYSFTNLGRWTSVPQPGFTRVNHEGMDGSVIAAPGLSGPTHGYAAASNYSLLTVADAFNSLSGTTPDLVLIDMGVNDMGRGRNPYYVANERPVCAA